MRLFFSDINNLKKIAKSKIDSGFARLEMWWSNKYNLPPNHYLFLNRSIGSLHIEMYTDLFLQKEDLEKDMSMSFGKNYAEIVKQLTKINRVLGESDSEDPLIDKWEKELSLGKTPNLEE